MYALYFITACLRAYRDRVKNKTSIQIILNIFKISRSTLYKWVHEYLDTQKLDLSKNFFNTRKFNRDINTYPKKITEECNKYILEYIEKNPQFNFKKLRKQLEDKFYAKISRSTLSSFLKKNNITRKRIQIKEIPVNKEKYIKDKQNLKQNLINSRKNFVSIDETAAFVGATSNYGYSKKGRKCIIKQKKKKKHFSVVMAITKRKVLSYQIIDGAFNGTKFNDFIKDKVIPKTKKALLLDNARIHHFKEFKQTMKDKKHKYFYNVAYSPEYNPIEYVFNTFKTFLKQHCFNTINELRSVINKFIKSLSGKTLTEYFNKSLNNLFNE